MNKQQCFDELKWLETKINQAKLIIYSSVSTEGTLTKLLASLTSTFSTLRLGRQEIGTTCFSEKFDKNKYTKRVVFMKSILEGVITTLNLFVESTANNKFKLNLYFIQSFDQLAEQIEVNSKKLLNAIQLKDGDKETQTKGHSYSNSLPSGFHFSKESSLACQSVPESDFRSSSYPPVSENTSLKKSSKSIPKSYMNMIPGLFGSKSGSCKKASIGPGNTEVKKTEMYHKPDNYHNCSKSLGNEYYDILRDNINGNGQITNKETSYNEILKRQDSQNLNTSTFSLEAQIHPFSRHIFSSPQILLLHSTKA